MYYINVCDTWFQNLSKIGNHYAVGVSFVTTGRYICIINFSYTYYRFAVFCNLILICAVLLTIVKLAHLILGPILKNKTF